MSGQATTSTDNSMKTSSPKFGAKDICSIIEACSKAGVTHISIGDINITFNGAKSPNNLTDVAKDPNNGLRSVPLEPVTDRDQELEILMITDPERYEEMVEVTE